MDSGVGTQEVIYGSYNYYDIFFGSFSKGIKSTVYDMIGEA